MRKLTGLPMAAVLVLCTALGIVGNAGFVFAKVPIPAVHKQPAKKKPTPYEQSAKTDVDKSAPAVHNQSARKKRAPAAPVVHIGKAKKAKPKPKPTKKN